ncbi:MAG: FAD-dependent thymidylate synthase [Jatrophihabitans sp.]
MVRPEVHLVAWSQFRTPTGIEWQTDADGGQALAEFAGRACYQAWDKTNPATASNAGYLAHVLAVGHLGVLEHASVSFYLTGISRSLSQELTRHRHFSFSQLSPRHLGEQLTVVEPPAIAEDQHLHEAFVAAVAAAERAHQEVLDGLTARYAGTEQAGLARKQVRQAARAVLPGATESRLVMSGNYRSWRHFIGMRASEHADREMRQVAVECLRQLRALAPNVFADFTISPLADGSEVAASPMLSER